MSSDITIKLVDGVRIVVPDSLNLISSYILREQEDWFEDEIKFLRHLIQPGQRVIDVGANYGAYTLTMAQRVGSAGHVWAFEPASSTANLLSSSIAINNFDNVVLVRSALSNAPGFAQLSVQENSELNELVRGGHSAGACETVPCATLDGCMDDYGWRDIDFVKIDAEGEEANILQGGANFLATESPLIQYEIKAGSGWHLDLVRRFLELGYQSYRLVPGLDMLVPFDDKGAVDAYLLNLFCCKPDRAARLAAQGFLVEAINNIPASKVFDIRHVSNRPSFDDTHEWHELLAKLPYGELLSESWAEQMTGHHNNPVAKPLFHYARSRDASLQSAERFASLEASYFEFKRLCETEPAYLRLSSLARVALDYGARSVAVNALEHLCQRIFQERQVDTAEPFLAPGARFDSVSPQNPESVANWIAAAAVEELERNKHYSSYYTEMSSLRRLEIIRDLGFGSDEMKRRLTLIKQRFGA
jgi:FkbM family methyltransferase